ncbi:lysophospholipid acyltransferase family protein [Halothiobacillus sp. DCM-1]|uniref:lysophospholipid acyltransferase family protein n=1 Tax=Halothiobacillus sp. DCM-1 TaxID=3112558 RepID=UPI00324B073A
MSPTTALNRSQRLILKLLQAVLRLLALLPQSARLRWGAALGALAKRFVGKRRRIMAQNLSLAFPEQDAAWRDAVIRAHFARLGADALESIWGWYGETEPPPAHEIIGGEHIDAARAQGRGVILNAGHFSQGELSVYLAARRWPVHAVYRPNDNPLIDELINAGRRRHLAGMIDRENTRAMIRLLREGGILWTAADQSYHGKTSAWLPFFGVNCTTNTAVPVLARMGRAVVLPYFVRREGGKYTMIIHPPLSNLPSGDDAADTARLIHILEDEIRAEPSAYLWGHRRYKNHMPQEQ